jgi:hypothetical protein
MHVLDDKLDVKPDGDVDVESDIFDHQKMHMVMCPQLPNKC